MSAHLRRDMLAEQTHNGATTPSLDQSPHVPRPRAVPVVAPLPVTAAVPIRIGVDAAMHRGLLAYTTGDRGNLALAAVRRFVSACAKAASGQKLAAVMATPATLLLPAHLAAALTYAASGEWSDGTMAALFAKLEPLVH